MIHKEILEGGRIKHYSDTYKIRKVGTDEIYIEAVDIADNGYEYEETDIPLEKERMFGSLLERIRDIN